MAVNDVWQGSIEFSYQGNPNTYLWYLQLSVQNNEDKVGTDVLKFLKDTKDKLVPLHNPNVVFICNTARQVHPTKSVPVQEDIGEGGGRTECATCGNLPGQCSMVVTLYGDKADPTRNNRGRTFFTGQCAADQVNGQWVDGIGSILQDYCDMYQTIGNTFTGTFTNEFDIGVFSPSEAAKTLPQGGNPPVDPLALFFFQLEFVRAKSLVRTQRRRQAEVQCEVVCDTDIT